MSRIPMSPSDLVSLLREGGGLRTDEADALAQLGENPGSRELRQALESLIERGRVRQLSTPAEDTGSLLSPTESLYLEDPVGRVRFRLHLDRPLPLRIHLGDRDLCLSPAEVGAFVQAHQSLVSLEKILSPRELVHELEQGAQARLPGARAHFHALEMPGTEAWPDIEWNELPIDAEEAEALTEEGAPVLYWPPRAESAGRLLIGMADPGTGWRGLLDLELTLPPSEPDLAKTHLVVTQYGSIFSTLIRLQGVILYDFLTGIHNRSYFTEQLERETRLAQRRDLPMALLIVDIDDFKSFNSRFGYDGGDRVLVTVACVLKAALRGTDTLARYGGEEFAVILASPVPPEEAHGIAERLRAAVEEERLPLTELDGTELTGNVTVSIGGAFFGIHGTQAHELWTVANREVLRAKSTGKNRVCFGEGAL